MPKCRTGFVPQHEYHRNPSFSHRPVIVPQGSRSAFRVQRTRERTVVKIGGEVSLACGLNQVDPRDVDGL